MAKIYLLALLVLCIQACEMDFGNGIKILWTTSEGEIFIELHVKESIYRKFGWVGIGIKHYEDGYDMSSGDFYTLIFENGQFEDKYAERNGAPTSDEWLTGENNLIQGNSCDEIDGVRVYQLKRWMATNDWYDTLLIVGRAYYWQWAYGTTTGGALNKHDNKGFMPFMMEDCPAHP